MRAPGGQGPQYLNPMKDGENLDNQSTVGNNTTDTRKIGVMDPDISNQVTQSLGYYQRQSGGIVYQNLKDEKALENYYYFG